MSLPAVLAKRLAAGHIGEGFRSTALDVAFDKIRKLTPGSYRRYLRHETRRLLFGTVVRRGLAPRLERVEDIARRMALDCATPADMVRSCRDMLDRIARDPVAARVGNDDVQALRELEPCLRYWRRFEHLVTTEARREAMHTSWSASIGAAA